MTGVKIGGNDGVKIGGGAAVVFFNIIST